MPGRPDSSDHTPDLTSEKGGNTSRGLLQVTSGEITNQRESEQDRMSMGPEPRGDELGIKPMSIEEYKEVAGQRGRVTSLKEYKDRMGPEQREACQAMEEFFAGRRKDIPGLKIIIPLEERRYPEERLYNERVKVTDLYPGQPGAPEVPIRIYTPDHITGEAPGLLYIHGGGFTFGGLASGDDYCPYVAAKASCVVVSVDYRLAPAHPFPAAPNDCYAALKWMATHPKAKELGIDSSRIGVQGKSAGGALAAAVALMARDEERDREKVDLCFQMLLYPVLDDRHLTESMNGFPEGIMWSRKDSARAWDDYVGKGHKYRDDLSYYAAPARAKDLSGLPPAHVMICELDVLRGEDIEYGERLRQAGVPAEISVCLDAIHGFDETVPNTPPGRGAREWCIEKIKQGFGLEEITSGRE